MATRYPILNIGKTQAITKVWLTRKDAATYLGVSTDYIKNLCNDAKFPWYKVGGLALIKKDDLDKYISKHRVI